MDPISLQQAVFFKEHPVIVETKVVVMTPAMKPCIGLHDESSVCAPISDWQDRGEDCMDTCVLHLHPQSSEVLLDLAQVLLYCVIGAHAEKN